MDPKCLHAVRQSRKSPAPFQVQMTQVANIQSPVRSYIGCTSQQHALSGKLKSYSPPPSFPGRSNLDQSKAHTISEVIVQKPTRVYTSQRAQKVDLAVKAKQNSPPPTPAPRTFNLAESKARDEAAAAEKAFFAQTQEQDIPAHQYDDPRIVKWLESVSEYF